MCVDQIQKGVLLARSGQVLQFRPGVGGGVTGERGVTSVGSLPTLVRCLFSDWSAVGRAPTDGGGQERVLDFSPPQSSGELRRLS